MMMTLMMNRKHNSTDEADFVSGVLCKDLCYWVIIITISLTHQSTLTAFYHIIFYYFVSFILC